jgi:hypothetical protein
MGAIGLIKETIFLFSYLSNAPLVKAVVARGQVHATA